MASSPPSHDVSENRKRPRALSFMSGGTDVEFSSAGTSSNRSSLSSAGTCMDNVPAGTITLESVRGKRTQRTMEKYGEMVQNDPAYTLPEYTLHPTTIFENAIISNPDELSNMSLNGCSMQIKWDLVNRNFRILDVSMNPLYSSAVTPFTNNCETWDWDRMLVSYIYHRPVQLGNGIRAPTFSFMPLGLRSLPMPVEAGEPYPRGK